MQNLKISLIQTTVKWEDVQHNLDHFDRLLREADPQTDLVLLPETFPTGFTMKDSKSVAQLMSGEAVNWMKAKAKQYKCVFGGSIIIEENNKIYNRFIWATPNGELSHYDKRHLFRMADENQYFQQGKTKTVVELKGWKINLMVCYDLRFPVWSRNEYSGNDVENLEAKFDLLVYVANWPMARVGAWSTLLRARAIENQCYVAGLNRVGEDGAGIAYNGKSCVIDPKGEPIVELNNTEKFVTVAISLEDLIDFRKKFPVGLDAD